jgi:hypothetical protein
MRDAHPLHAGSRRCRPDAAPAPITMEPRASLTAYVCVLLLALGLLSLRGFPATATALAAGLTAYAALLDLSYQVRRRHRISLVLPHRRTLDKIVRGQWLCVLVIGCGLSQGLGAANVHPLADDGALVQALVFGLTVGVTTVYASSLVDWYWVLPKVSGIVGPPPCTNVGGKAYEGVTKIWFFHRATATALLTFILAGVPAYVAGTIGDSGSERAILTALGAALAIGFNAVNAGTVWALRQFLGPRLLVGGYIRTRKSIEDKSPQDAYLVDVAIQGVKYKLEKDVTGKFVNDGELLPFHEADRVLKSPRESPICPSLRECRAANWYCIRNRNANGPLAPDDKMPAPLPPGAPDR